MATKMSALDQTPIPSPLPPEDEAIKQSQKSPKSSIQAGIDDKFFKAYFDIMVIGKTGVGKSTTADKILIANPLGISYEGAPHEDPTRDEESGHIKYTDMYMWHLSNKPNEVKRVETRLKNLVFCRSLEEPHSEVNTFHMEGDYSASTQHCELLSNDSTMVRVLDVPGFYGADACSIEVRSAEDRALAGTKNDLSIMRKILHIKMAKNFKFNRIVYFLPENGALKRYSQVLQTEIAIMENYFGRSIFESMVVVATYPASVYKFLQKSADLFPEKDQLETKHFFNEAMKRVFRSEDVPEPPIIFISLFDTCEDIFFKIKDSSVSRENVELEFNPSTCARCNIRIGTLREDHKIEHQDGILATCAHDSNWATAIPYEDSTCHPMMIPKYSKLQKVVGGIAHLITFKLFLGKWPSFNSLDEACIGCGLGPKSRGCTKVKTLFTKGSGEILVDHTSQVDESYVIKMDESFGEAPADTSAMVGATGVIPTDPSGVRGYTTTSVNYTTQARGRGDGGEVEAMEEGQR